MPRMPAPDRFDDRLQGETLAGHVRRLRKRLGLSQVRFAALVGIDQSTVSRWENGAQPDEAHVRHLARLADVHPAELRYGARDRGAEPSAGAGAAEVPVVGYVGAGQEVLAIDDHAPGAGLEEVAVPRPGRDGPMVAVRVRGDSMHPMRDGWILFYRRDRDGVPESCVNRLCVVKVADDGPMLVKEVRRGYRSDRYMLLSWNAPPREDVRLDWAAEVLAIRP